MHLTAMHVDVNLLDEINDFLTAPAQDLGEHPHTQALEPARNILRSTLSVNQSDMHGFATPTRRHKSPIRFSRLPFAQGPTGHFVDAESTPTKPLFSSNPGTSRIASSLVPALLAASNIAAFHFSKAGHSSIVPSSLTKGA